MVVSLLMATLCRKERECIHSILKTTKESKTYYFADFALTVVLMNKADNCVPITAPSVRLFSKDVKDR